MKSIIVNIERDGSSTIEVNGMVGQSCSMATRELELVLAGTPDKVSDEKKPDYYQTTGVAGKIAN